MGGTSVRNFIGSAMSCMERRKGVGGGVRGGFTGAMAWGGVRVRRDRTERRNAVLGLESWREEEGADNRARAVRDGKRV
jgi:hypothetical protein